MKLDKVRMEAVARRLKGRLGDYWRVRVVEKGDEGNAFDPPCRYVEGVLFGFHVRLCDDGEWGFDGGPWGGHVDGVFKGVGVADYVDAVVVALASRNEGSVVEEG